MPVTVLTGMLNRTITIERNAPTKDASGGIVDVWAAISGASNIKAARWGQPKRGAATEDGMGRRDGEQKTMWVIEDDIDVRVGDRVNESSVYYDIQDVLGRFDHTLGSVPVLVQFESIRRRSA